MSRNLRILYVIGSMGNGRAGTERSLLTLINNLDRSRFEPLLISLQDCEYIRAGKFSCETHCWHTYRMLTPRMFARRRDLASFIREKNIDVVQTFFTEAHLVAGAAARKAGVKMIISSRRNLGYSYDWKARLYLRIANRYPTHFLANSQAVVKSISAIEQIPENRFRVIYNGVELREPMPWNKRQKSLVIMIANLRPVKSIPTLIDAAKKVVSKNPEVRFRIIGEGPDRLTLQARINQEGLQKHFEMPGSTSDVHTAVATAQVGVLTSTSEGFSNSILEYMVAALPVVVTRVGGNSEIVRDEQSGFVFDAGDSDQLADKISLLINSTELAERMGQKGRKLVEQEFSIRAMIDKHQRLYSEVAD